MTPAVRVGIGYDIHRLAEGRRLVVGGVEIEHSKGLVGHSDADVVLHAVTDALLGAAGLPDIGDLFPDTDPAYAGADSRELLRDVVGRIRHRKLAPSHIDVIIHAEAPALTPYQRTNAEPIAGRVGVPPESGSVKAKTNEGMGPLGLAEAIACTAVALLMTQEKNSAEERA